MNRSTPRNREESPAELAYHMADAIAYLCKVAREANLEELSADLILIHQRLLHSAPTALRKPPDTGVIEIELDRKTSNR